VSELHILRHELRQQSNVVFTVSVHFCFVNTVRYINCVLNAGITSSCACYKCLPDKNTSETQHSRAVPEFGSGSGRNLAFFANAADTVCGQNWVGFEILPDLESFH